MTKNVETSREKSFNTLELSILGIIVGLCLGIITALIVVAVNLAYGELPNNPPDWEVTKWAFSISAAYFGFSGAAFGGLVGFCIGVIRWAKVRERQEES